MANDKNYAVGDEVTISGVVTNVGSNGGNPEYTIAVNDENVERPISVPPRVHPAAFTNGPVELAEENQKTYDAVAKEGEKAAKEQEENNSEEAGSKSDAEETRKETVTPDPKTTPAGQGAKGTAPKAASSK